MNIGELITIVANKVWGWPLILFVLGVSVISTVRFHFVQFRSFVKTLKLALKPEMMKTKGDMSPFQALLNALSVSLGNGSLAGMATAVYAGGPGVAVWVFVLGLLSMALRFAEVYLGTYFPSDKTATMRLGGPMIYLQQLPAGKVWATLYAFFLLFLGFAASAGMQSNSMCIGCMHLFGVSAVVVAVFLFLFTAYVVSGGAHRIVKISDAIVPLKVVLFFGSAFIVLGYHYKAIIPALYTIFKSAFCARSFAGGCAWYSVQQAMRYGFSRSINASEAGVGSAAVFFGGTNSHEAKKSALISMLSVFISANLVCFLVVLMIVATGVISTGQTSLALTIAAYETVFGSFGGWIVTFLSLIFGLGVLVSYSYVANACWLFLTGGRFEFVFQLIYCCMAFAGALGAVEVVWHLVDIANAGLLILNLCGILWLLPLIAKSVD